MTTNRVSTVILDEGCEGLEPLVSSFAPTRIFRRRAGFRSEPSLAAEELRAFIESDLVGKDAVYVAPSFAAFTALLLEQRAPGLLAGILLLDPSHPEQGPAALTVLNSPEIVPSAGVEKLRALFSGFGPVWEDACHQVSAIRHLGDTPLLVLAGGRFDLLDELPDAVKHRLIEARHQMLAGYARRSTKGEFHVIPDSGHDIARDAPARVGDAIRSLLNRCRRNTRAD